MGGKGSGRKFRWKAILIPKNPLIAIDYCRSFIKFADSPEELMLKLSNVEHSLFYEIRKIEITRAKGRKIDEINEMVRQRIREAQMNAYR